MKAAVALVAAALLVPLLAGPVASAPAKGSFEAGEVRNGKGAMAYRTYVPARVARTGSRVPLVVALHGGNESIEQTAAVTGWNLLADEYGFVVVYPQEDPDNGRFGIWDWSATARNGRDDRGASLVALVTRTVIDQHRVDAGRVLVAGMSAGAGMAVGMAVNFPELYAAVAAEAGCMYGSAVCMHPPACTPAGCDTDGLTEAYLTGDQAGRAAFERMGKRAHRMPAILSYGTADPIATVASQDEFREQWLMVNDLVDDGEADASVPREPADSTSGEEQGRTFQRDVHTDADGCLLLEHWAVEGLGHAYSGGRTDDGTEPDGPDMRRHQYEFFQAQTTGRACRAVASGTRPDARDGSDGRASDAVPGVAPAAILPATGGGSPLVAVLLASVGAAVSGRRRR